MLRSYVAVSRENDGDSCIFSAAACSFKERRMGMAMLTSWSNALLIVPASDFFWTFLKNSPIF